MKVADLKKLLDNVNDDYDIYVRDINGMIITHNLQIKTILNAYSPSYLIED